MKRIPLAVTGFGERKAELYGKEILAAFAAHRNGARAAVRQAPMSPPAEETIRLLAEGKAFEEIAQGARQAGFDRGHHGGRSGRKRPD